MADIPKTIQIHLNEIAERLSQGKATVMVGAGFSKNAVKMKNTDKKFLNWNELGDLFYEKLYGEKPDEKTGHYLDALRMAGNIESTFGRPALDRILIDNLPDEEYEPSDLHKELLKLNWADVFTTNYDTLLERTRKYITNRKYQIVVNKDDLVYSQCPRIIKLHGSFPSERPFVISQEDYRKYPKDSAAFVNTVQQALLENIMCLVGFSGDDPNFLNWLGWIRDNLGKNTPKIYFISVDLSPRVDNALLESRNIVVLNMAECFAGDGISDIGALYREALNLFIREIRDRQKAMDRKWIPKRHTYGQIRGKVEAKTVEKEKGREELSKLYECWKESRQGYPGWIIMPYKFRYRFVDSLENFEHCLYAYRNIAAKNDDNSFLEFLKVYDWVRQMCLLPLTGKMFRLYDEVLLKAPSGDCRFLELKISILEYYRHKGMFSEHKQLLGELKECPHIPDEQRIRVDCEEAYAALYQFDFELLEEKLGQPADCPNYDMELSYVGLLWECDQYKQGCTRLVNALDRIRCTETSSLNMKALSQEAYIINLFGTMARMDDSAVEGDPKNDGFAREARKIFSEYESQCYGLGNRRDFLKLYDCNPESETELFQKGVSRQKGTNVDEAAEYEESVQFIEFIERTGMRMLIDTENEYYRHLRKVIRNIGRRNLYWAIVLSVRTRERKLLRDVLADSVVAACPTKDLDAIAENVREWIKNYYGRVNGGTKVSEIPHKFMVRGSYMPEVLSVLIWYVSAETRRKIFKQILEMASKSGDYTELNLLVRELLSGFDISDMKENLYDILNLFVDSDDEELLYCIAGCDIAFYERPKLQALNKDELLKKLRFLKNGSVNNLGICAGITYRIALLYYVEALNEAEIQWFQEELLADLKKGTSYPLEMYYYICDLVMTETEIRGTIQNDIASQLVKAVKNMDKITEFYRFGRKFELVCEAYRFTWKPDFVENMIKMTELLKKDNGGNFLKYSCFFYICTYIMHRGENGTANKEMTCRRYSGVYDRISDNELQDIEKEQECLMAGIMGKNEAAFMNAARSFYQNLENDFNAWKDCVDQVVLILCMTAQRESMRAVFCLDMIRRIWKLSKEGSCQIRPGKIADLLKFFLELPVRSDDVLLAKAGSAKLAYDLFRSKVEAGDLQDIVKQWELLCKDENSPALIRKQWYDITY